MVKARPLRHLSLVFLEFIVPSYFAQFDSVPFDLAVAAPRPGVGKCLRPLVFKRLSVHDPDRRRGVRLTIATIVGTAAAKRRGEGEARSACLANVVVEEEARRTWDAGPDKVGHCARTDSGDSDAGRITNRQPGGLGSTGKIVVNRCSGH